MRLAERHNQKRSLQQLASCFSYSRPSATFFAFIFVLESWASIANTKAGFSKKVLPHHSKMQHTKEKPVDPITATHRYKARERHSLNPPTQSENAEQEKEPYPLVAVAPPLSFRSVHMYKQVVQQPQRRVDVEGLEAQHAARHVAQLLLVLLRQFDEQGPVRFFLFLSKNMITSCWTMLD